MKDDGEIISEDGFRCLNARNKKRTAPDPIGGGVLVGKSKIFEEETTPGCER